MRERITVCMPVPKGSRFLDTINSKDFLSLSPRLFDQGLFDSLVAASPEYQELKGAPKPPVVEGDDLRKPSHRVTQAEPPPPATTSVAEWIDDEIPW
jgi:hypothetical protein